MIRNVPDEIHTLLVLGHAPGIPDLVEHLCIRTESLDWTQMDNKLPTSALAVVNVPGPWAELGKECAELANFIVPRDCLPSFPDASFGPSGVSSPGRQTSVTFLESNA